MTLERLTESELAEQERALGVRVHFHDGVWWREEYPFYSKPLVETRVLVRGRSRPALRHSLLGYSHPVADPGQANRTISYMVMSGTDLDGFSIKQLRDAKRAQVRKGLRSLKLLELDAAEPVLEDLRQVNISQALRQQRKSGFGLSADYYTKRRSEWETQQRHLFAQSKRGKWGAFLEGRLVAYALVHVVEDTAFITAVKCHTDQLTLCASDALYFTFLERLRDLGGCALVVNGAPSIPSLDRFKEQFLFRPQSFGVYTRGRWLIERGRGMATQARRLRALLSTLPPKGGAAGTSLGGSQNND